MFWFSLLLALVLGLAGGVYIYKTYQSYVEKNFISTNDEDVKEISFDNPILKGLSKTSRSCLSLTLNGNPAYARLTYEKECDIIIE